MSSEVILDFNGEMRCLDDMGAQISLEDTNADHIARRIPDRIIQNMPFYHVISSGGSYTAVMDFCQMLREASLSSGDYREDCFTYELDPDDFLGNGLWMTLAFTPEFDSEYEVDAQDQFTGANVFFFLDGWDSLRYLTLHISLPIDDNDIVAITEYLFRAINIVLSKTPSMIHTWTEEEILSQAPEATVNL